MYRNFIFQALSGNFCVEDKRSIFSLIFFFSFFGKKIQLFLYINLLLKGGIDIDLKSISKTCPYMYQFAIVVRGCTHAPPLRQHETKEKFVEYRLP